MWIRSVQFEVWLYDCTHTALPNWQCLVHTRHSLSFMSLVHRPRGYLAHCANGKLDSISRSFFKKAKEHGTTNCRAEAVYARVTQQPATKGMNINIFQNTVALCIQFTWGQTELRLQGCRTCERAPRSAHLDHLTQWQQGALGDRLYTNRGVCVCWSTVEPCGSHSFTRLQREEPCRSLLNNL